MHVLTFLFKMRVLENASKLMNHGITRYSFMARDSSSVATVYRGKTVTTRKIDLRSNVIEKCLYIRDYILDVYTCIWFMYIAITFYKGTSHIDIQ